VVSVDGERFIPSSGSSRNCVPCLLSPNQGFCARSVFRTPAKHLWDFSIFWRTSR